MFHYDTVTSVYICYWSLLDPLCQGQSLKYLKGLAGYGYKFALITFEQPLYEPDSDAKKSLKVNLAEMGIRWYPLKYHKRLSLLATAWDCFCGILTGIYIYFRHRPRIVHSRASIPALIALFLSFLPGLRFIYDADSALSEEYADVGHWARDGVAYKLAALVERYARQRCDSLIVLTEKLSQEYQPQVRQHVPITVIPCCVDSKRFAFSPEARIRIRAELGLQDEKLLVYAGKVGSWYLVEEMFEFFNYAVLVKPELRLLILSGDSADSFHHIAKNKKIDKYYYQIRNCLHADMPDWLSACDGGFALIKIVPSKRGSSPVKVGEYLSIGLPVIITPEIGDCSDLIESENLGIVIHNFTPESLTFVLNQLARLWTEGDSLRNRCRASAIQSLDLQSVGITRYREIYRQLLGA